MIRVATSIAVMTAAFSIAAADVPRPATPSPVDKLVEQALPLCDDAMLSRSELPFKLPENLTGSILRVASARSSCEGQYVVVTSREGGFYLGTTWPIGTLEGTPEQRLKEFAWKAMQENFSPVIDRQKTRDGLYRVTMLEITERGKVPIEGEMDPAGTIFFLGHFHPMSEDVRVSRLKLFEPFVASSPTRGAAQPEVTVIEFSDFECPSCRRASGFLDPVLAKLGDHVRYVRYDLPLLSAHPWAFAAAIAGRAVYRQKPDAFWEYKKHVYENQDKLTAFTFDDFARGFAQDHELNLARYDADIASEEVKSQILKGIGTAFSNDIRATPTYLINGAIVDPGAEGKDLGAYIEKLIKKPS